MSYDEVSTESGPGSPREHLAWGGGCDRVPDRRQHGHWRGFKPVTTALGTDSWR